MRADDGEPDATPITLLSGLSDQVCDAVSCCGAAVAMWRDGEGGPGGPAGLLVASHPDLGEIAESDTGFGGPLSQARAEGGPVHVGDTLRDRRWPEHSLASLRHGVRTCTAVAARGPDVTVVVAAYGLRPAVSGGSGAGTLAVLAGQAAALVTALDTSDAARRQVRRVRAVLAGRWPIEQAKGMIMQALGCDADRAFAELRRVSQTSHLKVHEVARRLVGDRGVSPA
ncbi:hypothetical protein FHS43_003480 [Streptosporangium becharense]|uniref:ANTAR domain-containing protein n=1 Tax=Streptosporangium becharense TaxID=1816182 RepID=A0A7W9IDM2_9ACTN|nr:ANTAR domain-containing protein [Streptosporangium becharense]MBB2912200.1 hypothetical protein [Streptosporangium becharense]MBB5818747.1 hypothetical protein [Streptosporangium becharense]